MLILRLFYLGQCLLLNCLFILVGSIVRSNCMHHRGSRTRQIFNSATFFLCPVALNFPIFFLPAFYGRPISRLKRNRYRRAKYFSLFRQPFPEAQRAKAIFPASKYPHRAGIPQILIAVQIELLPKLVVKFRRGGGRGRRLEYGSGARGSRRDACKLKL